VNHGVGFEPLKGQKAEWVRAGLKEGRRLRRKKKSYFTGVSQKKKE